MRKTIFFNLLEQGVLVDAICVKQKRRDCYKVVFFMLKMLTLLVCSSGEITEIRFYMGVLILDRYGVLLEKMLRIFPRSCLLQETIAGAVFLHEYSQNFLWKAAIFMDVRIV